MSKLVMKNNINSELSITHADNKPAKNIVGTDIAVAVDTINDFPLDASDGDTVIVRDLNRGGTFIYDSTKIAGHNDGTNFNGWIRQYSGPVNVKWFGLDGIDDSIAISKAKDSLPETGGEIILPESIRIATSILIDKKIKLVGLGCNETSGISGATTITVSSTMTDDAIVVSGMGNASYLGNFTIQGEVGNTSNGISILAGRVALRNIGIFKMGKDGVHVGSDSTVDNYNCNLGSADRLFIRECLGHGFTFHDGYAENLATGPNCNGWKVSHIETSLNGGDGLRIGYAWYLTAINIVPQGNAGYGINATTGSRYSTFVGGEQNEGNALGQVYNAGNRNTFFGTDFLDMVDVGGFTAFIGAQNSFMHQPTLYDRTVISDTGSSELMPYAAILRRSGNALLDRGIGLKFDVPSSTGTYRDGATIEVSQQSSNVDKMEIKLNKNGVLNSQLKIYPTQNYIVAGGNNTHHLGADSYAWLDITATTYRSNGLDGVSGTFSNPTSITVTGGIITAIS